MSILAISYIPGNTHAVSLPDVGLMSSCLSDHEQSNQLIGGTWAPGSPLVMFGNTVAICPSAWARWSSRTCMVKVPTRQRYILADLLVAMPNLLPAASGDNIALT